MHVGSGYFNLKPINLVTFSEKGDGININM